MTKILMDSGPLVAYALASEQHHEWARDYFDSITEAVLTCETVLGEASYLLARRGGNSDLIWALLRKGGVRIAFDLEIEFEAVAVFMRRYADVPMALADACLVRMSELHRDCRVWTLDNDFKIYRRFGRQVIPLISPC